MKKNKRNENELNYDQRKNEKDKNIMRIKSKNKIEYLDCKIRN